MSAGPGAAYAGRVIRCGVCANAITMTRDPDRADTWTLPGWGWWEDLGWRCPVCKPTTRPHPGEIETYATD